MCGEKKSATTTAWVSTGSPPRVRGKAGAGFICPPCPGITPACAGKRGGFRALGKIVEDHPRVFGEKICEGAFKSLLECYTISAVDKSPKIWYNKSK